MNKSIFIITTFVLFSCMELISSKNIISIDCSHFPSIVYNNKTIDTSLLKSELEKLIMNNVCDTIQLNIECVNNIVYSDVIQTQTIINNVVRQNNNKKPIIIYNKCFAEFKPPFQTKTDTTYYLTLYIDENGSIFEKGNKIDINDLIKKLEELKKKEIIKLICADNLSIEKFTSYYDKLNKTGFKIILDTIKLVK